jgi:hypothetical protein
MMQTTNFFIPRESFHFSKGSVEEDRRNRRRRLTALIRSKTEPDNRLWKLSMEAASLKACKLELIAFLFFGALASVAAMSCGAELFHMANSGALEQTVQTLLSSTSAPVTDLVH